jgi:LacI family transcriptional regulator
MATNAKRSRAGGAQRGTGAGGELARVRLEGRPQRATLREVAVEAGVHPATASRALNEETRSLVAASTAARVLEAARVLDYRPNHLARGLKTRRSATIGVVLPDLTNPLFPPIVRGIEDLLGARGYVALVANTDNDDEREARVLTEMRTRHVDGLIVATARRYHDRLVEVAHSGTPLVLINRVMKSHLVSSVSVDDEAGVRAALAHLVELGHRRIACVAGPQELSTGYGRYRGYLEGLRAAGIEPDPALVSFASAFAEEEGYRCAEELFARRRKLSAIIAGNDMLALGVLRSMQRRKIPCPASCSLVGFNDMPFMDRITPPLTTVRVPHYEVGYEAARLLLEKIRDETAPVTMLRLLPELVVRESSAPLRVARPPRRALPAMAPAGRSRSRKAEAAS